jgi:putative ABC transport system permease protein
VIRLETLPYTVVGVMSPEFQYPTRDVQIWTPLTINPADFQTRTGYGHLTVARLKPGVTLEQAQSDVSLISTRLAQEHPKSNKDMRFSVTPLRRDIAQVARRPLIVLLAAALGLLLIGCCNLVSLLLARALTRSRETAVRSALGASQARLIRQAAAELLPILLLGSFLGVLAAKLGIELVIPWLPYALPRVEEIEVNLPVLFFSSAILFITAVLVLLLPAIQASCTALVATLRDDSRTSSGTAGKATIRNLLVVGQVALTVILVTGAGLLIRTFAALKEVNPGFRPQGVLSLRLAVPRNKYGGDEKVAAFCQRILEQVRAARRRWRRDEQPYSPGTFRHVVPFLTAPVRNPALGATDDTTATRITSVRRESRCSGTTIHRTGHECPLVVVVDEQVARRAWPERIPSASVCAVARTVHGLRLSAWSGTSGTKASKAISACRSIGTTSNAPEIAWC